jgi:hypothetical protein
MIHICTHSDKNYLLKGMALNHSLEKAIQCDYTLHYLCLDDEIYKALVKYNHRFIKPMRIAELEQKDKNIALARKMKKSNYGDDYSAFAWALSSIWINYCLKNFVPADDRLFYADSDIYFYTTPMDLIRDAIINSPNESVGIHRHRFGPFKIHFDKTNPVGEFNVGVLNFKNNLQGNFICERWKNLVLDPEGEHFKEYGTCGDQKWWDLLWMEYNGMSVYLMDKDGGRNGHMAPWNCSEYQKIDFESKKVLYYGTEQNLVFYHFSHFTADFEKDIWSSSLNGEWKPDRDPEVAKIYQHYFDIQKQLKNQLESLKV